MMFFVTGSCKKDSGENGTVKDGDGHVYSVVKIGTQLWTAENLRATKYNDGKPIPLVTNNAEWESLNSAGFCWYDNDSDSYKEEYGALYNWDAVNSGKLAPVGWHVATDADFAALTKFLGSDSVAGGKLKEKSTTHWAVPNTGATNASGFTAIPGGFRHLDGRFFEIGQSNNLWTSSHATSDFEFCWGLGYNYKNISRNVYDKRYGFSVRCVKD